MTDKTHITTTSPSVRVTAETKERLKELRKDMGLRSVNAVIVGLLNSLEDYKKCFVYKEDSDEQ